MNVYLILGLAIIAEIISTSALKVSHGFSRLIPSLIVIGGYSLAFWLLSLTLKTLPVSIVYAIWSGLGIVGIALIGIFYFREPFGLWHFLGISSILIGVIILNLVTSSQ